MGLAATTTRQYSKNTQTTQLLLTHWREMSRNASNFYFTMLFPFIMFGMFLGMGKILKDTMSGSGFDFSTMTVPMGLCLALTGTCMTLTATPISDYRQHGTLRVLGTTPVSRTTFILTHLLVRLVVAVVLSVGIILVGLIFDVTDIEALGRAVLVIVPSCMLFLGLGYILGSLINSGQVAANITTLIQMIILFTSGVGVPFIILPDNVLKVLDWVPTTYFGDLLFWVSGSSAQRHSLGLDFAVVGGSAVIAVLAAVFIFKWDAGD